MERKILGAPPMPATALRGYGAVALLAALCLAGCGGSQISSNQYASSQSPYSYVAFTAAGSSAPLETLAIDHTADTFVQDKYSITNGSEQYVFTSGTFTALPNGILNIGVTFGQGTVSATSTGGTTYNPPQTGNWAIEWPGQGGFAGLLGLTVTPFAPNQACPTFASPSNFQFVTFPIAGDASGTAYGQVSIAASGSTVNFSNVSQFNISGGAPANPSPATAAGTCGPTVYGQTISVPNSVTVTDPGSGQKVSASATIAVGPSGFLVEGNGAGTGGFQNLLGAGVGAVGLPQPSSALNTSNCSASTPCLVGQQYVGFIYSTGSGGPIPPVPAASHIASFGFPNLQAACPTLPAPQTATILYGGEFNNNNPSANAYGNCDFAVDLGTQDPKNNGLYPSATVWVGSAFPRTPSNGGYRNQASGAYSFPAVAIAGLLQGKYVIYLVALDTTGLNNVVAGSTQDWGIYLLQSN